MFTNKSNLFNNLDYQTRSIDNNTFASNNIFHRYLYNQSFNESVLVTINNRSPVAGSVDIGTLLEDGVSMNIWLAQYQIYYLYKEGIKIPNNLTKNLVERLISSYFLSSCLCVTEVKSKDKTKYQLVTKNAVLLDYLKDKLSPRNKNKDFSSFNEQCSNHYDEFNKGEFSAVHVFFDKDGIKLSKCRVSDRSAKHLIPYYAVNNYAGKLIEQLKKGRIELTYLDEGVPKKIYTTLNTGMLCNWFGFTPSSSEKELLEDWKNPLSFGYLSLPNLNKLGLKETVPILEIINLKECKN